MDTIKAALDRLGNPSILVVGDLILDRYVEGEVDRVSPEAPVLVFRSGFETFRLGGAGNVAANVVAAGGRSACLGTIGDDEPGRKLIELLAEAGIDTSGLVQTPGRPTTRKTRFVRRTHQVMRVDEEDCRPPDGSVREALLADFRRRIGDFDAVVLSDYGKGVLGGDLTADLIRTARETGVPLLVDPKGSDYTRYRGATLVTPNKHEAEEASGVRIHGPGDLAEAASRLLATADLDAVVITLGPEGIHYRLRDGTERTLPTEARSVFDVTGAGDTVVAVLALGLGGGLDLDTSVRLANVAAGIVVGRFGTASVTREEIRAAVEPVGLGKVLDETGLAKVLVSLRRERRRIVFTNGCFDLLHPGHLEYLETARGYGDVLIVGVNDDDSIRRAKGAGRPVNPLADRLAMLAGLSVVDYVVPFGDDTPLRLIEKVSPHVLVKGEDWRDRGVVGREWVEAHGGSVVLVPLKKGYSTSSLIERIRRTEEAGG